MEVLGPFIPLAQRLGTIAAALSDSADRVEVEHMGRIAERDTRLLTLSVLNGLFTGRTEEDVNLVNAPALAEERGIQVSERREVIARDYADLMRVTVVAGSERVKVVGTTLGHQHRPHLLEAWGQRFNLQIDEPHLALFRYSDVPGMVGRVGTCLGEHGINISAAAVGRQPLGDDGGRSDLAVMAVTTDVRVPDDVVAKIAGFEGFVSGRSIALELGRFLRRLGGRPRAAASRSSAARARAAAPRPRARGSRATSRPAPPTGASRPPRNVMRADIESELAVPDNASRRVPQASVGPELPASTESIRPLSAREVVRARQRRRRAARGSARCAAYPTRAPPAPHMRRARRRSGAPRSPRPGAASRVTRSPARPSAGAARRGSSCGDVGHAFGTGAGASRSIATGRPGVAIITIPSSTARQRIANSSRPWVDRRRSYVAPGSRGNWT